MLNWRSIFELTFFSGHGYVVTHVNNIIKKGGGVRNHCNCGWDQRSKYSLQEIHPDPKCQCRVYICLHLVNFLW